MGCEQFSPNTVFDYGKGIQANITIDLICNFYRSIYPPQSNLWKDYSFFRSPFERFSYEDSDDYPLNNTMLFIIVII